MYNKLQYISQGNSVEEQIFNIEKALYLGCKWVQLRYKTQNLQELYNLASAIRYLCDEFQAILIINDNVELAKALDADGVHLGLDDMDVRKARAILGNDKIIGGTANTFEHILQRAEEKCDYIGLGPFQFTTTKAKLSPVLGLEGYKTILEQMKNHQIEIPVYAIGGIQLENVTPLMTTGIYGIAVSGLISQSQSSTQIINELNEKLYVNI